MELQEQVGFHMDLKSLLQKRSFVMVVAVILLVPAALYLSVAGMGTPALPEGSGDDAEPTYALVEHPQKLNEGGSGEMAIPYVGGQLLETDQKQHWDMPPGIVKVKAMVTWQGTGWDFKFDIGTGNCPSSGEAKNGTQGDSGELVVEYSAKEGEFLDEGEWFAHIGEQDVTAHRGDSTQYTFVVWLYSYGDEECDDGGCPA